MYEIKEEKNENIKEGLGSALYEFIFNSTSNI